MSLTAAIRPIGLSTVLVCAARSAYVFHSWSVLIRLSVVRISNALVRTTSESGRPAASRSTSSIGDSDISTTIGPVGLRWSSINLCTRGRRVFSYITDMIRAEDVMDRQIGAVLSTVFFGGDEAFTTNCPATRGMMGNDGS